MKYLYDDQPQILGDFCDSEGKCQVGPFLDFIRSKMYHDMPYAEVCSQHYFERVVNGHPHGGNGVYFIVAGVILVVILSVAAYFLFKKCTKQKGGR